MDRGDLAFKLWVGLVAVGGVVGAAYETRAIIKQRPSTTMEELVATSMYGAASGVTFGATSPIWAPFAIVAFTVKLFTRID